MDSEIAIRAEHISKTFLVPHEKGDTLRERLIHFQKKKRYEIFEALTDVSFEIKKGEFFGIIGRNGSGKSTLLKILAGIYTPDCGKITRNGEVSPFLELGVGFNPDLSGRDNIYLNGTILGLSKKEIRSKFKRIVDFSELDRFIDQKLKNYSSGMQVRLAFSVAIHANKDILIMDEVLAVGDAGFQLKCFEIFEEIINNGKTIIFVSHDTISIQKYSNRVLYLESGKPIIIGSPSQAISMYMYTDIVKDSQSIQTQDIASKSNKAEIIEHNSIDHPNEDIINPQLTSSAQKIVEILEVRFFEDNHEEKSILTNGRPMQINILYNVIRQMNDLIFGVTIRNHLHQDLFITNTFTENISTGEITPGKWMVSFNLQNVFAAGKYSIKSAVSDKSQRIIYDLKDDFAYFHVQNPNRIVSYIGIDIPHQIIISEIKT